MKNILYLGIEHPSRQDSKFVYDERANLIHYPIIKIIPTEDTSWLKEFQNYTHLVFTSKTAVKLFFDHIISGFNQKEFIAVGKSTARFLKSFGVAKIYVAIDETAEGVVEIMKNLNLTNSFVFWPHSKLSRSTIIDFFINKKIKFHDVIMYDTVVNTDLPQMDLTKIHEIVFTSPSTVDAFLYIYKAFPQNKMLTPIGPVTDKKLENCLALIP